MSNFDKMIKEDYPENPGCMVMLIAFGLAILVAGGLALIALIVVTLAK